MFYSIQIKGSGEELSRWKSREDAEAEVERQEAEDKKNGQYEDDYYCIEEKAIYHVEVCQYILPWRETHGITDFREFEQKYIARNCDVPVILEETFDNIADARASFEMHKKSLKRREESRGGNYARFCISWDSVELSEENDENTTDNIDFACAEYREED